MRSGLLFKLAIRKPNIFLNEKHLFNYTFLESECLQQQIRLDPLSQQHKLISELLRTPFSAPELIEAPFLESKLSQHIESSERIRASLQSQKHLIVENITQLAYKNILDIQSWRSIFVDVLEERFEELEDHPHLDEAFKHLENFFSRFDIKNSKFYMDRAELPNLIPINENMTSIFNLKKKIGPIKLETSIMSFFIKASSKVPVNLDRMRMYYKQNLVDDLRNVLERESNIVDIARLEVTLDAMHLAKDGVKEIFTKRVKELMSKENLEIKDTREYLTIATNWACVGEMRDQYKKIFDDTFDCLLQDSPAALLQAVVTCHQQTPENINRILSNFASKPYELVSRKPQIHRVLHILAIRGHDLSAYQEFVDKVCAQSCESISQLVSKYLTVTPRSNCMKSQNPKDTTYSPNLQHKWISNVLKFQFKNNPNFSIFFQTKICRFDVLFGVIKNNQIYVIEIPDLNMVINKARNYKGTVDQKRELFKHYNITILELNLPLKYLSYIVNKRDKVALIKEVKALLQSI